MISTTPWHWRLIAKLFIQHGKMTPFCDWLLKRAEDYNHLPGYMNRWYILQPPKRPEDPGYVASGWRKWVDQLHALLPFYMRFHYIQRADLGRHKHDHPWWFRSIILGGWYTEECEDELGTYHRRFWAGDVNAKNPGQYHRIATVADDGVLTLVIHGRRRKDSWGFKVNGQHIFWRTYLGLDNDGASNEK